MAGVAEWEDEDDGGGSGNIVKGRKKVEMVVCSERN